MRLNDYLASKRRNEVLLWAAFFVLNTLANGVVATIDQSRSGNVFSWWEPWVWEATSSVVWFMLLPLVVFFDRRYPLQSGNFTVAIAAHLLFTVPFALIHVCAMFGIRSMIYQWVGGSYQWGQWWGEFGYEYLKDFRGYFWMLTLIYLYRFVLLRLQGLAEFVAEGPEEAQPQESDRFLVKKLGREFLVKIDDIDWLEASGNYVNLHVGERTYPLRETMTAIEARLASAGFARVHRSAIVNLDRVREIVPFDTGEGEAHLTGDQRVPVSRRYRKELRERLV